MAFEERLGDRTEVKRLFRQLRRIRATKEAVEHTQTMDLCRQAAETLESSKDQKRAVDLQEHAIRNAQKSARRAEAHERHDGGLDQARKRQQERNQGRSVGL